MNQFNLVLDLDKSVSHTPPTVRMRQGDQDGTVIAATIYDHGAAPGGTVTACAFVMRLPNSTYYYRKGATWVDGVATVTVDERQAASVVGRTALAYFTLTVGGAQYSTGAFVVVVEPDAVGDAEPPESYDDAIQDAIDRCNAAAAALERALPIGTANLANGAVTPDKLADAVRKGYVRSFETVADMQAATDLKAGMTCHTNGFHASGDGGAAYYTVSTSGTANGMDVLALQGGLFATLVVTEPYVTPEQFGAWGDGTHDDTTCIQQAISQYKYVILGAKTYVVTSAIRIPVNGHISGASEELTTLYQQTANAHGFIVEGRNSTIENMGIACAESTTSAGIYEGGYAASGAEHLNHQFSNLYITGYHFGMNLDGAILWDSRITNVRCRLCDIGMQVVNSFNLNVLGFYADRCSRNGVLLYGSNAINFIACNFGIYADGVVSVQAGGTNPKTTLLFEGCNFEYDQTLTSAVGGALTANNDISLAVTFINCRFIINGQPAAVHTISFGTSTEATFIGNYYDANSETDNPASFFNVEKPPMRKLGSLKFVNGNRTLPRPSYGTPWQGTLVDMENGLNMPSLYSLAQFQNYYQSNAADGTMFFETSMHRPYMLLNGTLYSINVTSTGQ